MHVYDAELFAPAGAYIIEIVKEVYFIYKTIFQLC